MKEQRVLRGAGTGLSTGKGRKRGRHCLVVGHAAEAECIECCFIKAAQAGQGGKEEVPKELPALSVLVVIIVITMSDEDGNGHNDATANNNKS